MREERGGSVSKRREDGISREGGICLEGRRRERWIEKRVEEGLEELSKEKRSRKGKNERLNKNKGKNK